MLRVFLGAIGLLLATLSSAAFDLQVLSKYRVSGPIATQMKHVARGPSNTAYISGTLGHDVFIAQIDQFGTILRTTIWDSPRPDQDQIVSMGVAADGTVTLFLEPVNGFRAYVVKFSPALKALWEWSVDFGGYYSLRGDTSAEGLNYVIAQVQGSTDTRITVLNPAGVVLASVTRSLAVKSISGVAAFSAPAAGIAVFGRGTTQAAVTKLESTSAIEWERSYGQPTTSGTFRGAVARPDGSVWLVGNAVDGGQVGLYGWMTASVNAVNSSSTYANLTLIAPSGENTAFAMAAADPNSTIVRLEGLGTLSTSISLFRNVQGTAYLSLGYVPGLERVWAGSAFPRLVVEAPTSSLMTTGVGPTALATVDDETGVGVESISDGTSRVIRLDEYGLTYQPHTFSGNARRYLSSKLLLPDGSLVVAFNHDRTESGESTVVKYRPDGTIAYARTLTPAGGSGTYAPLLVLSSDGYVWVLYSIHFGGMAVTKLNANGIPLFTRTSNINFSVEKVLAGANGEIFVLNYGYDNRLVRIKNDGYVAYVKTIATSSSFYSSLQGFILSSGKMAVTVHDSELKSYRLLQVAPATGDVEYSTTIANDVEEFRMAPDPGGSVTLAYRVGNSLVLRRRSGANLATQLSAASFPGIESLVNFTIAPNGKLICVVRPTSSQNMEMRNLTPSLAYSNTSIVEPSVQYILDMAADSAGQVYVLGREVVNEVPNGYAAKYLANGARSAQRRLAGEPFGMALHPSAGIWIAGAVDVRNQGRSPFVARYSP